MKVLKILLSAVLSLTLLVGCGGKEQRTLVIVSPNSDTEIENIIPPFFS